MSFFGNAVSIKDGQNLDAFSRLRVSIPTSLFESQQEYGLSSILWETSTSGTNSEVVADTTSNMVSITSDTGSTDYAVVQSRQYVRYIPGKGHTVFITGVFKPGSIENNSVRVGYFDSSNGIFLRVSNGVASVVRRTSTSGVVEDNEVTQDFWNIDKFDGLGPSGILLDLTKTQILFIQAQWLGVGRVVIGFDINGTLYPAHQFLNANVLTVPYTRTFNLPVRIESRNSGTTTTPSTVKFVCCSVQSDGGQIEDGLSFSVGNGISTIAVTSRRAVLAIRPKETFKGLINRGHIELTGIELSASSNASYWELVYNGAIGGTPTWSSVNDESITEYSVNGTTVTGGITIASGFAQPGSGSSRGGTSKIVSSRNPLTISKIDSGPTVQNTLTLVCTSFASTSNISSSFSWFERYI